jgi:hypothetical protein
MNSDEKDYIDLFWIFFRPLDVLHEAKSLMKLGNANIIWSNIKL